MTLSGQEPPAAWQPTYPVWAPSVAASTFAALLAAPAATSLVAGGVTLSPLQALVSLGRGDAAGLTPMALLVVVGGTILASVPPGLLSLFLITVTDVRLIVHPLVGALFFGLVAGLMAQSAAAALFGLVFGLVSVGGTAAMLALHRHLAARFPKEGRRG